MVHNKTKVHHLSCEPHHIRAMSVDQRLFGASLTDGFVSTRGRLPRTLAYLPVFQLKNTLNRIFVKL